jgi:hypothetical protein
MREATHPIVATDVFMSLFRQARMMRSTQARAAGLSFLPIAFSSGSNGDLIVLSQQ